MCLASSVITTCDAGGIGIRGGEGWANAGVRAHPKADSRSNTGGLLCESPSDSSPAACMQAVCRLAVRVF